MDTGMRAWIANHEFDFSGNGARIDLPGGWHWDIQPNNTGYLKTPDGNLCVGYDLGNHTIQFGDSGKTSVEGLNLWTIQKMGEKFARENFMDPGTAKEYDTFAKERAATRRAYETKIREEIKGFIKMELKNGSWTAHVDVGKVKDMAGIETKPELSGQDGIKLFNQISMAKHVMPLRDPMGYMTLDNNTYDYIKDQYDFQYNDAIDNIDAGFLNGNGYGCDAVLEHLDRNVRKNIREFCLPVGMHYQDLRHVAATPEIRDAVDEFVKWRVTQTINYEKKRDHTEESLQKDYAKYLQAGEGLREAIACEAVLSLDIPEMSENAGLIM